MNYWLVKFAPFRYKWKDILRNGKFEIYSVRNAQARNNLKKMKLGDLVLFYHSQTGQSVMGKMIVIEEAHQDKTTDDTRWVSVTFEPVETFQNPIALELIKEQKELQNMIEPLQAIRGLLILYKYSSRFLCKTRPYLILTQILGLILNCP